MRYLRPSKARTCLTFAALLACGIAACSGRPLPFAPATAASVDARVTDVCNGQTPPPASTPPPSSAIRGQDAQKTPLHGLIDLGQVSADNMHEPPYNTLYYVCRRQAAISGIVVNDTWRHMQPHAEGERIDTRSIDAALREIAAYNAMPGRSLGVRLRVWAGIDAPGWAKRIGGAPIQICDGNAAPKGSLEGATPAPTCSPSAIRTVGRFWSDAYERAWRSFQRQVANRYDKDLRVSEISLSSCSSLTNEPFVEPEDGFSREHLIAAGYSDAKYQACLLHAVQRDYASFWHLTPVDFSFNPFREIEPRPPVTDLAFTEEAIDACRKAAASRCILLNEAMAKFTPPPSPNPGQTPSVPASYYLMWNYMKRQGGSITFQTASPPNLLTAWGTNRAGWNAGVSLASSFGASSVELFPAKGVSCRDKPARQWISGYSCFGQRVLAGWKNQFH